MKRYIRVVAAVLALLLLVPSLVSCGSQPIRASKKALRTVGTVGEFEVSYEELYFLVQLYREELELTYGENASSSSEIVTVKDDDGSEKNVVLSEYYAEELKSRVYENITSNYSVLSLASDSQLSLDDKEIEDEIQNNLDLMIEDDFDGSRRAYKEFLDEKGMTDHYVRFSLGVDAIYSALMYKYLADGIIDDRDETVKNVISEEFIRTWHIMILNEDKARDNKKIAEEALDKIKSGTSMYQMIGSKYNEDFLLTTIDGYYFTKGVMDEAYEEAAYALEENEISGIVESVGQNAAGTQVGCYYIIQRLPLEEAYIEKNLKTLKTTYYEAEVYKRVENVRGNLSFKPNDYCDSLDLMSLDKPGQTDTFLILIVTSVAVGVCLLGSTVWLAIYSYKKKLAKRAEKKMISKGK